MSEVCQVRPLRSDQIVQSYPLVSMFEPALTQEQWIKYASALVGATDPAEDPNIIAAQNERGYIYGLSAYRVRPDLHRGQILDVESFAVADLVGITRVAVRLLETLESLALQRSCGCLSLSLINPSLHKWFRVHGNSAVDVFRASGYHFEPLRLRKCFQTNGRYH